ncbi:YrrS family protein [Halobacillus litoralis]|uniref:YrrS family protein n=1 Tax=Halobacillus litoralis TaxID=45668 RepID=UPI001CFDE73E|nr:YrrS family protein [Halobacillus litoralis]
MANKHTSESRTARFEKRRRGTKWLTWFVGIGSVFLILFVSMFIFRDGDQRSQAQKPEESSPVEVSEEKQEQEKPEKQEVNEEESDKQKVSIEGFDELEPIEEEKGLKIEKSDDPNVDRVVTKDWPVIPTEMETNGNHSITYKGEDYQELLKAIRSAVGLSEDNIIYWDVSNGGGPKKSVAVVSDKNKTGYLRVYVEWIDQKGYKPVKLEVLNKKIY